MSQLEASNEIFASKYVDKNKSDIVLKSILHAAGMPEKSLWPKVTMALNHWFKVPKAKFERINNIIRLIQISNNVLTDASENAVTRKGTATANSVYGVPDALNSAYYTCFLVFEKLRDLNDFEAVKLGNDYYLEANRGQGMEIYWRDNVMCPTEVAYIRMGARKTGSLLKLTIGLMQLFSENKSDFGKLIEILGKFFHIYDDYISLYNMDEYLLNKNGTENISEGKFSFPLVHAIRTQPDDVQLINILRRKSTCDEVIAYFLTLLEKFGSLQYTKDTLKKLKEEAYEEMKQFEDNPFITQIFENILSKLEIV